MQAKRFVFSSPVGQVSNMAAISSGGFLPPSAGIWKNRSAF
jgi:hypothetical protein